MRVEHHPAGGWFHRVGIGYCCRCGSVCPVAALSILKSADNSTPITQEKQKPSEPDGLSYSCKKPGAYQGWFLPVLDPFFFLFFLLFATLLVIPL